MKRKNRKYKLGFSAGALLSNHYETVIFSSVDCYDLSMGRAKINSDLLEVNSEKSQKRYLNEVFKRLKGVNATIISGYASLDSKNKRVFEFFTTCKHYLILTEFMIEIVRDKWLNLDNELSSHDFKSFLLHKLSEIDELDHVSELTINKVTQVALKMLKESGLFDGHSICRIEASNDLLSLIAKNGDEWFLDVMLLSDEEKNDLHI